MLEFHRVLGDLLSSVIRRLSLCASRKFWMNQSLTGKIKQLVPRDLVGPGARRQAVLFSETHATTLDFCDILCKGAANYSFFCR